MIEDRTRISGLYYFYGVDPETLKVDLLLGSAQGLGKGFSMDRVLGPLDSGRVCSGAPVLYMVHYRYRRILD